MGLDRIDQRDLPGDRVYRHPNDAPGVTAHSALVSASTKDCLCDVPAGTPNRLLYVGSGL